MCSRLFKNQVHVFLYYFTASKSLPLVQPIQECPGFKCKSGISKCLPLNRKCDKIVDCLHAEDEVSCDFTDMRSVNALFSNGSNNTDRNKSSEKRESVLSQVSLTSNTIHPVYDKLTTEETITSTFKTSTEVSTTSYEKHESQTMETTVENKTPDYTQASTTEVSLSISFEEIESDSTESVTADPTITNYEITDTRGDLESLAMPFTTETLETRASIKKETKNESDNPRRTDIIEEDGETTNTLSETLDSETQGSEINTKIDFQLTTSSDRDQDSIDKTISVVESKNLDKVETKAEEFVLELLPNSENSSKTHENSTNKINKIKDQVLSESSAVSFSTNNLPDLESKSDFNNKIEDMVFDELQPASIRRKHRVPKEFECRR